MLTSFHLSRLIIVAATSLTYVALAIAIEPQSRLAASMMIDPGDGRPEMDQQFIDRSAAPLQRRPAGLAQPIDNFAASNLIMTQPEPATKSHQLQLEDPISSASLSSPMTTIALNNNPIPASQNIYTSHQQQTKYKKPVHVTISQESVNRLLTLLLFCIISICGSMGGIFILSSLTVIESLQTRGNCFLVSLIMSQLLISLLVLPSSALQVVSLENALNGSKLCHYQWLTLEFTFIVSQLSFLLMAADNYLAHKCNEKVKTVLRLEADDISHQHQSSRKNNEADTNYKNSQLINDPDDNPGSQAAINNEHDLLATTSKRLEPEWTNASEIQDMLAQIKLADLNANLNNLNSSNRKASWIESICLLSKEQNCFITSPLNPSTPSHHENDEHQRSNKQETELEESIDPKASSLATRIVQSQLDKQIEARLIRPNWIFSYRTFCGHFKVLLWISLSWLIALGYTLHEHELAFGTTFCSSTTNNQLHQRSLAPNQLSTTTTTRTPPPILTNSSRSQAPLQVSWLNQKYIKMGDKYPNDIPSTTTRQLVARNSTTTPTGSSEQRAKRHSGDHQTFSRNDTIRIGMKESEMLSRHQDSQFLAGHSNHTTPSSLASAFSAATHETGARLGVLSGLGIHKSGTRQLGAWQIGSDSSRTGDMNMDSGVDLIPISGPLKGAGEVLRPPLGIGNESRSTQSETSEEKRGLPRIHGKQHDNNNSGNNNNNNNNQMGSIIKSSRTEQSIHCDSCHRNRKQQDEELAIPAELSPLDFFRDDLGGPTLVPTLLELDWDQHHPGKQQIQPLHELGSSTNQNKAKALTSSRLKPSIGRPHKNSNDSISNNNNKRDKNVPSFRREKEVGEEEQECLLLFISNNKDNGDSNSNNKNNNDCAIKSEARTNGMGAKGAANSQHTRTTPRHRSTDKQKQDNNTNNNRSSSNNSQDPSSSSPMELWLLESGSSLHKAPSRMTMSVSYYDESGPTRKIERQLQYPVDIQQPHQSGRKLASSRVRGLEVAQAGRGDLRTPITWKVNKETTNPNSNLHFVVRRRTHEVNYLSEWAPHKQLHLARKQEPQVKQPAASAKFHLGDQVSDGGKLGPSNRSRSMIRLNNRNEGALANEGTQFREKGPLNEKQRRVERPIITSGHQSGDEVRPLPSWVVHNEGKDNSFQELSSATNSKSGIPARSLGNKEQIVEVVGHRGDVKNGAKIRLARRIGNSDKFAANGRLEIGDGAVNGKVATQLHESRPATTSRTYARNFQSARTGAFERVARKHQYPQAEALTTVVATRAPSSSVSLSQSTTANQSKSASDPSGPKGNSILGSHLTVATPRESVSAIGISNASPRSQSSSASSRGRRFPWLVALGLVFGPTLASGLLFARAYFNMKRFKGRPYSTLPAHGLLQRENLCKILLTPQMLGLNSPLINDEMTMVSKRQLQYEEHPTSIPAEMGNFEAVANSDDSMVEADENSAASSSPVRPSDTQPRPVPQVPLKDQHAPSASPTTARLSPAIGIGAGGLRATGSKSNSSHVSKRLARLSPRSISPIEGSGPSQAASAGRNRQIQENASERDRLHLNRTPSERYTCSRITSNEYDELVAGSASNGGMQRDTSFSAPPSASFVSPRPDNEIAQASSWNQAGPIASADGVCMPFPFDLWPSGVGKIVDLAAASGQQQHESPQPQHATISPIGKMSPKSHKNKQQQSLSSPNKPANSRGQVGQLESTNAGDSMKERDEQVPAFRTSRCASDQTAAGSSQHQWLMAQLGVGRDAWSIGIPFQPGSSAAAAAATVTAMGPGSGGREPVGAVNSKSCENEYEFRRDQHHAQSFHYGTNNRSNFGNRNPLYYANNNQLFRLPNCPRTTAQYLHPQSAQIHHQQRALLQQQHSWSAALDGSRSPGAHHAGSYSPFGSTFGRLQSSLINCASDTQLEPYGFRALQPTKNKLSAGIGGHSAVTSQSTSRKCSLNQQTVTGADMGPQLPTDQQPPLQRRSLPREPKLSSLPASSNHGSATESMGKLPASQRRDIDRRAPTIDQQASAAVTSLLSTTSESPMMKSADIVQSAELNKNLVALVQRHVNSPSPATSSQRLALEADLDSESDDSIDVVIQNEDSDNHQLQDSSSHRWNLKCPLTTAQIQKQSSKLNSNQNLNTYTQNSITTPELSPSNTMQHDYKLYTPSQTQQDRYLASLNKQREHLMRKPRLATLCTYAYMPDDQLLRSNIIVFLINISLWTPFIILWLTEKYRLNYYYHTPLRETNDPTVQLIHKSLDDDTISGKLWLKSSREFKELVWWISTLNCCSCSYFYAISNRDFRDSFNKLFYYFCCKAHVSFPRKMAIYRRQLDVDSKGNLKLHIFPALNLHSSKLSQMKLSHSALVYPQQKGNLNSIQEANMNYHFQQAKQPLAGGRHHSLSLAAAVNSTSSSQFQSGSTLGPKFQYKRSTSVRHHNQHHQTGVSLNFRCSRTNEYAPIPQHNKRMSVANLGSRHATPSPCNFLQRELPKNLKKTTRKTPVVDVGSEPAVARNIKSAVTTGPGSIVATRTRGSFVGKKGGVVGNFGRSSERIKGNSRSVTHQWGSQKVNNSPKSTKDNQHTSPHIDYNEP